MGTKGLKSLRLQAACWGGAASKAGCLPLPTPTQTLPATDLGDLGLSWGSSGRGRCPAH